MKFYGECSPCLSGPYYLSFDAIFSLTSLPVSERPYWSVQITSPMLYLHAKFGGDRSNGLGAKASLPVLVVTSCSEWSLPVLGYHFLLPMTL